MFLAATTKTEHSRQNTLYFQMVHTVWTRIIVVAAIISETTAMILSCNKTFSQNEKRKIGSRAFLFKCTPPMKEWGLIFHFMHDGIIKNNSTTDHQRRKREKLSDTS